MEEIPKLIDEGITSLKLFMAYKGVFQVDDTTLFRAMMKAAEHGMLIMVHAENGDVIAELFPNFWPKVRLIPNIMPWLARP